MCPFDRSKYVSQNMLRDREFEDATGEIWRFILDSKSMVVAKSRDQHIKKREALVDPSAKSNLPRPHFLADFKLSHFYDLSAGAVLDTPAFPRSYQ